MADEISIGAKAIKEVQVLRAELVELSKDALAAGKSLSSISTPGALNTAGNNNAKTLAELEALKAKYASYSAVIVKESEKSRLAEIRLQQQREKAFDSFEKNAKKEQALIEKNNSLYNKTQAQINNLTKAYNDLAVRKARYNDLTAHEEKRLVTLEAVTNKYNGLLKATDAQIGKNQRNVGNYASGYNALGNSINQLTREAPAFANSINTGFMAISNNIPALTDAIAGIRKQNELLRSEGKPTQSVLSQLGSAFFSWNTLISVGVTLLTVYGGKLIDYAFNTDAAKKATDDLTASLKKNEEQVEKNIKSLQYQASVDEGLAKRRKDNDLEIAKIKTKLGIDEVNEYEKNYNAINKKLREFDDYRMLINKGGNEAFLFLVKKNNGDIKKAREEFQANENKFTNENRKLLIDAQTKAYDKLKEQNDANVANQIQSNTELINKNKEKQDELLKNLAEMNKAELELQLTKNEALLNNEDSYYSDRITALNKDKQIRFKIAQLDYDEDVRLAKDSQEKKKTAYVNYQIEIFKIGQDYVKKRADLEKLDLDSITKLTNVFSREDLLKPLEKSAQNANKQLEKTAEHAEKARLKLLSLQAETNNWLKSFSSEFLQNSGLGSLETFFDGTFNALLAGAETTSEKFGVYFNSIAESAQEAFNLISQYSQANFDDEKERLQSQYDIALGYAGDNKAAQEKLAEDLAKKKEEIANRENKAKKQQAIFNIGIDTAQAIIATFAKTPPPAGIPLAALITAIGAAQIAMVASQEIPKYWMGGTHDGGLMMVNDGQGANFRETIVTPDGKIMKPQGRNVIMDAPVGTEIFTHDQWRAQLDDMLRGNNISWNANNNFSGISKNDMREVMMETIANTPTQYTNFDENGVSRWVNKRGNITRQSIMRSNGKGSRF